MGALPNLSRKARLEGEELRAAAKLSFEEERAGIFTGEGNRGFTPFTPFADVGDLGAFGGGGRLVGIVGGGGRLSDDIDDRDDGRTGGS